MIPPSGEILQRMEDIIGYCDFLSISENLRLHQDIKLIKFSPTQLMILNIKLKTFCRKYVLRYVIFAPVNRRARYKWEKHHRRRMDSKKREKRKIMKENIRGDNLIFMTINLHSP